MPGSQRFQVDSQRVAHETIEGETILIHLQTGTYYSLTGSGADIWNLLTTGWSEDEVVAEMQRRDGASPDVVAEATRSLVADLSREGLLSEAPSNGGSGSTRVDSTSNGEPFSPPKLEKFTDLQYFLLLDPIHEVEDAGWPHERPAGTPG